MHFQKLPSYISYYLLVNSNFKLLETESNKNLNNKNKNKKWKQKTPKINILQRMCFVSILLKIEKQSEP